MSETEPYCVDTPSAPPRARASARPASWPWRGARRSRPLPPPPPPPRPRPRAAQRAARAPRRAPAPAGRIAASGGSSADPRATATPWPRSTAAPRRSKAGKVVKIKALELQGNDPQLVQISSSAEPILQQEALARQTAAVDTVGWATSASASYTQSLQSALDKLSFEAPDQVRRHAPSAIRAGPLSACRARRPRSILAAPRPARRATVRSSASGGPRSGCRAYANTRPASGQSEPPAKCRCARVPARRAVGCVSWKPRPKRV